MKNFKVREPRVGLDFELAFTAAHRRAVKECAHPAELELACMRAQYPAILMPIEDGDLIAGRVQFGKVGWGIQDQTVGSGFYYDEAALVKLLEEAEGSAKFREDVLDLLTYWKANSSYNGALRDAPDSLRRVLPHERWAEGPLAASPIIRMAGAFIDFDKLVQLGLPGLRAEVEARLANVTDDSLADAESHPACDQADGTFHRCCVEAIALVGECCLHYRDQATRLAEATADSARRAELLALASALEAITRRAPASLLEAIQLCWIYGMLCPLMEFGRMDVYLGDLYVADVDSGRLTQAQALRLVQSYFRMIDALDGETDGRVVVGGYGRRNQAAADRFCLVAIEACRTVKEVLPQFTLRFNRDTPAQVWDAAMRCIGEGRSYPLLYNDDRLVDDVATAFGVDRTLAEQYMPLGCGEIELDHHSFGSPNGFVNTLKALELAIRGGRDPMALEAITIQTKPLVECASFAEFIGEYRRHLTRLIEALARYERYLYDYFGARHPYLLISTLYDGCLDRGCGILAGGCAYLHGSVELYGNVNVANALAAIKQLVFDDGRVCAAELVQALDDNFVGHERLRKLLLDAPKYGNDLAAVDELMCDFHDWISAVIADQAAPAGLDGYLGVTINNSLNTDLGRWIGATPDGRKAGTPLANANNPASGTDRRGVTAMLNSIRKPRHDNNDGMVQNMRFTRETWLAGGQTLLRDYFDRDGAQAMVTVVGRDELRNAMLRPQDYQDLMVRIGGFSARFVTLRKDIQQEILDRVSY